jgi:hypothetical protein
MTEDPLVGIRVAYRQKKIGFEEKILNGTGWSGVARRRAAANAAAKS